MTTKRNPRYTAAELTKRIHGFIAQLAEETDAARLSDEFQRYLDFSSKFHKYSWRNQMLIWIHNPDASYVAGYKKWPQLGRHVRKGEKGIPILAPIIYKSQNGDSEEETRLTFKVVYVFDVSQTEGDPLTEPEWKSPEKRPELHQRLIAFAESRGIKVTVESLNGSTQGYSAGGYIALDVEAGTSTLIHEIAHELLHQSEARPDRKTSELQAEAVAYTVGRHFGLESGSCPNYLVVWNATASTLNENLEIIAGCAAGMINALDGRQHEGQQNQPWTLKTQAFPTFVC